jgi:hypothetical protein
MGPSLQGWGSANWLRTGDHFRKAKVPASVHANTMQQPAICIESFSDRVDQPETMKKIASERKTARLRRLSTTTTSGLSKRLGQLPWSADSPW